MLKLNDDNYYSREADKEYFSVSQFKSFLNCEAEALAEIKGEWERPTTKAMLVGSYVDAYFEGTLPDFISKHSEIFTKQGTLKAEYKKAEEIIKRIESDELFMQFLSGDKQKIITFEMYGVPWKMKMDSYIDDVCIADLKVVSGFKNLPNWRYDIQGAIYQKGVEIALGKKLPFYLAVATKEEITDLDIFQIPQPTLDEALEDVELMIDRFKQVKTGVEKPIGCGMCDYCKSVKKASIRNYNEL